MLVEVVGQLAHAEVIGCRDDDLRRMPRSNLDTAESSLAYVDFSRDHSS